MQVGDCTFLISLHVVLQVGSLPNIQVRYDSSEALYLRKALRPRFAPHRVILRKSANPGEPTRVDTARLPWCTGALTCAQALTLPMVEMLAVAHP